LSEILLRGILLTTTLRMLNELRDPKSVTEALHQLGREMGEIALVAYLRSVKGADNDLGTFLSKSIPSWFKTIMGRGLDNVRISESGKTIIARYSISDCRLCSGIISPSPDLFICEVVAGALEWIADQRSGELGFEAPSCHETACRARGDGFCEFTLSLKTKI